MKIEITYTTSDFFDGCDNIDNIDADATINAWEALVRERIQETFPAATIEIEQKDSGRNEIWVDDATDDTTPAYVRSIMNAAFSEPSVWVSC